MILPACVRPYVAITTEYACVRTVEERSCRDYVLPASCYIAMPMSFCFSCLSSLAFAAFRHINKNSQSYSSGVTAFLLLYIQGLWTTLPSQHKPDCPADCVFKHSY